MYFFDISTFLDSYPKLELVSKGITTNEYYVNKKSPILGHCKFYDNQNPTRIVGNIYEINDEFLKELDIKNGYPYISDRKLINIVLDGNDIFELTVDAYAYFIF